VLRAHLAKASLLCAAAQGTELSVVGVPVRDAFAAFATETGRKVSARRSFVLAGLRF